MKKRLNPTTIIPRLIEERGYEVTRTHNSNGHLSKTMFKVSSGGVSLFMRCKIATAYDQYVIVSGIKEVVDGLILYSPCDQMVSIYTKKEVDYRLTPNRNFIIPINDRERNNWSRLERIFTHKENKLSILKSQLEPLIQSTTSIQKSKICDFFNIHPEHKVESITYDPTNKVRYYQDGETLVIETFGGELLMKINNNHPQIEQALDFVLNFV